MEEDPAPTSARPSLHPAPTLQGSNQPFYHLLLQAQEDECDPSPSFLSANARSPFLPLEVQAHPTEETNAPREFIGRHLQSTQTTSRVSQLVLI